MAIALRKGEKSAIIALQKQEAWEVIVRLLDEQLKEWNGEPASGTNEFEVLRSLHRKEGKVDGLKEFFDKLERAAFE